MKKKEFAIMAINYLIACSGWGGRLQFDFLKSINIINKEVIIVKEWLKNNSNFSLWEWLYNSIRTYALECKITYNERCY